jgi:Arc/MetJ-type ribon-helix-helix transcriptional regulator
MKSLIVRLPEELHDALKHNRQFTGTSAAEFVRRAIRLALFSDAEAANRTALWKSLPVEERQKYTDFSCSSDLVPAHETSAK